MYFLMFFPDTKEVEIKYPKIQLKPWLMIIISYEGLLNQKRIIKWLSKTQVFRRNKFSGKRSSSQQDSPSTRQVISQVI